MRVMATPDRMARGSGQLRCRQAFAERRAATDIATSGMMFEYTDVRTLPMRCTEVYQIR